MNLEKYLNVSPEVKAAIDAGKLILVPNGEGGQAGRRAGIHHHFTWHALPAECGNSPERGEDRA